MASHHERVAGTADEDVGGPPDVRAPGSPFPRSERALRDAAVAAIELPPRELLDDFCERLDEHRPTVFEHGPLDRGSQALQDLGRRARVFRRLLGVADALAGLAAVLLVFAVFGHWTVHPSVVLIAPLIVVAAKGAGLYDKDELVIDHSTLNELPRLVNLATMLALLVWLARGELIGGEPTTINLLTLWLLLVACLGVGRAVARRLAYRLAPIERCLLVGRVSVFERLRPRLDGYPGVSLVGHIKPADLASDFGRLRRIAERDHIQRIIIDTDATSPAETLDMVRGANATGLQVSLVPTVLGAVGGSVVFDDIGGLVLMGVPRFGLSRSSMFLKRSFDLAGAGVALVVLAPVMLVIAAVVAFDSKGPILFRQTRMGRNDVPFEMLKFRSMVDGAEAMKEALRHHNEADGLFKIENDPRITRTGRLLRRTGLDELPQLINVLGGSMSLVGPRPLVIDEDRQVTGFDRRRLHLTPGITGRWQTLGAARVPLSEMVKIDYLYIANWSPWADLRIIFDTLVYLLRRNGL